MEVLLIAWVAYIVYIGTRSKQQTQNHLALMWAIMIGMTVLSVGYNLIGYAIK